MIYCMINTSNLAQALADKYCTTDDELPLYVLINGKPVGIEAVALVKSPVTASGYVLEMTLPDEVEWPSNTADGNTDEGATQQPAEVMDPAFIPQSPASGGSGGIDASTGPAPRTTW